MAKILTKEDADALTTHQYHCIRLCLICNCKLKCHSPFSHLAGVKHKIPVPESCRVPNPNFILNFEKVYKTKFIFESKDFPTLICRGCVENIRQVAAGKRKTPPTFAGFPSETQNYRTRLFTAHCAGEDNNFDCTFCAKSSTTIIDTQGIGRAPKSKSTSRVRVCNQPFGPDGAICQVLIGPGRPSHTCGVTANVSHATNVARLSLTEEQVASTLLHRLEKAKKKLDKTLKTSQILELELKNVHGRPTRVTRVKNDERAKNNANKEIKIEDLLDLQRSKYMPDNRVQDMIRLVKKSGGKTVGYREYHSYVRELLFETHGTSHHWLPFTFTKSQNEKEKIVEKYAIEEKNEHLAELKVNKTIKNVSPGDKGNYKCLKYCGVAFVSDMRHLIQQIMYFRNIKEENLVIKFQADGGGGTTKLSAQFHDINDLKKKNYIANSCQTLIILAETVTDESAETLEVMWQLLGLDYWLKKYTCCWVSDLKLMNIMMGLTGGNARHACCLCDKNFMDKNPYESANARDFEIWKKRISDIPNDAKKAKKMAKDNFSVERKPVSMELIEHPEQVMPPEFHMYECVINKVGEHLKSRDEVELIARWEGNIHQVGYQGGKYTGNLCSQLLDRRAILEEKYPDIATMLEIFHILTKHLFTCGPISTAMLDHYSEMMDLFKEAWQKTEMSVTHKVHYMIFHAIDTMRTWNLKLGSLSEQDGESLHHYFEEYRNYTSNHSNHLSAPLEKWNRERLRKHPKKYASKRPDDPTEEDLVEIIEKFGIALL